jgi:tetratricopeptide (TPR) repeat protein
MPVEDHAVPTDWYRNTTWDPSIERDFRARLGRARAASRPQYLLLQAGALEQAHPTVTLELLSHYFALPMERPDPAAHVVRARALLALERVDDAIASYEAALAREREFPNILTQAYLELPCLIAERHLRARYDRAVEVLGEHQDRPTFPIEHFRWNAVNAVLLAERGAADAARSFAQRALEAAEARHSGFQHHPSLGLVGEESADLIRRLRVLATG